MIVTIYKNCKLNNKYKDVFYNQTYLNGYLSNLTSVVVLQDNEVYSRNEDYLYIDGINIQDFKEYNYLKIEDTIGVFYAFIDEIKWLNEAYVIYYSEDIMSNYIEKIHIRNSLLTRCKSLSLYKGNNKKNIKYYKLPLEPESNDDLIIQEGVEDPLSITRKINVIVKLQLYKLNQAGEQTDRICINGIIDVIKDNGGIIETLVSNYNLNNLNKNSLLDRFIFCLINNRAKQQIVYQNENYYYDIDKIYAVPQKFVQGVSTETTGIQLFNVPQNNSDGFSNGIFILWFLTEKIVQIHLL